MSARRLLFVATEDWFVRSHFLHLIARAREIGFAPIVAARMSSAANDLRDAGAELRPLEGERRAFSPAALAAQRRELHNIIARDAPDIVHAIALKPSLLTGLSLGAAPQAAALFAITGLGYLAASRAPARRLARALCLSTVAALAKRLQATILFENEADRNRFARRGVAPEHLVDLPGAGVDLGRFAPLPEPPGPPYRIGLAARLVKSKGVDIAVEAVRLLRSSGEPVELMIAGAPDPENPASYSAEEVTRWSDGGGVRCLGAIDDINRLWAQSHVAVLPSRGGEGLPKALIEAAACARPIVTTDTPGCRDFVRDREMGFVAPCNDPRALAEALRKVLRDEIGRRRMGARARSVVEGGYTHAHVADRVQAAWESTLRAAGLALSKTPTVRRLKAEA